MSVVLKISRRWHHIIESDSSRMLRLRSLKQRQIYSSKLFFGTFFFIFLTGSPHISIFKTQKLKVWRRKEERCRTEWRVRSARCHLGAGGLKCDTVEASYTLRTCDWVIVFLFLLCLLQNSVVIFLTVWLPLLGKVAPFSWGGTMQSKKFRLKFWQE